MRPASEHEGTMTKNGKPIETIAIGDRIALRHLIEQHVCPFNIPTCQGCCSKPEERSRKSRCIDELVFWQSMADITGLKSVDLNWQQLKQVFASSYWSPSVVSHSKYFLRVFQWLAPAQSLAMNAAHDALCLIYLGSRYCDQRLLIEGQVRHGAALKCMQQAIEKPDEESKDTILGAAYTLGHCEIFLAVSQHTQGWIGHMGGFQALIELRGPHSFRTPFARAMLHNVRQVHVMESFLKRKASYLATPEWMASAEDMKSLASEAVSMAHLVGVAIEKSDKMCLLGQDEVKEADIMNLLSEMLELEDDLNQWLVDFSIWSDSQVPFPVVSTTRGFPSFRSRLGRLVDIVPRAIEFPSFLAATNHCYIWICLLLLRQSILDVSRLHPYPLLRPDNQDAVLLAAVDETAENLCQSIAYCTNGDFGYAGILACGGPLYFASQWYRQRDATKLLWCERVTASLQRDVLLSECLDTSLNLQKPVFTWWMLPDIFTNPLEPVSKSTKHVRG